MRNGSRGMLWLEPLVEVATAAGPRRLRPGHRRRRRRAASTPGCSTARAHRARPRPDRRRSPGSPASTALTFARVGVIDPLSPDDYEAHGGLAGLRRGAGDDPGRRRRRGHRVGAARPRRRGLPGRASSGARSPTRRATVKFVCCNADEGDSGTFADRMLMEGDPFIARSRAWTIAGLRRRRAPRATSTSARSTPTPSPRCAPRSRSPHASAAGSAPTSSAAGVASTCDVRVGAGAYICGEETSMLESLEGKRGMVRAKPPLPALEGLFGQPTVVNNVLTLATVPIDPRRRRRGLRATLGVGRSRGTQVFQLAGNVARGGIVETAFGITLGELVEDYGGGTRSGRPVRAVQVGGPLGAYLPPAAVRRCRWTTRRSPRPARWSATAASWCSTTPSTWPRRPASRWSSAPRSRAASARPCRIGAVRGVEVIDRIVAGEDAATPTSRCSRTSAS